MYTVPLVYPLLLIEISLISLIHSGLCPDNYPDEVCRRNFTRHVYNPLLYDLHSDPSEIYNLNLTVYSDVLEQINMVRILWPIALVVS